MSMRAAVYHSFGGPIKVENVPKPVTPPDDGVIIKVMATGVCRSDWHGWKGHDNDIIDHGLPFIPGHEFSGIIAEVGKDLLSGKFKSTGTVFAIGDRVTVPFILSCGSCHYCRVEGQPTVCTNQKQPGFTQCGSFAEYISIPRAAHSVTKLPRNVSFEAAAALGCRFTTAYRAVVQQGKLCFGESVAIFGCGGLGLSCIMIAKASGASKIIAVDISSKALRKAKELGATHVVPVPNTEEINTATRIELVRKHIKKIVAGNNAEGPCNGGIKDGADLAVDAAGFNFTCECAIMCTKRGGRMIQVGLPIGASGGPPQVPMGLVVGRELQIIGSHGFKSYDLPILLQMISNGQLDPTKLIEKQTTLEHGARAIQNMDRGSPLGIVMVTKFDSDETNDSSPSSSNQAALSRL